MNKFLVGTMSLVAAISLNATVFATVNGKDITELELSPLIAGMGNVNIAALPQEQRKELIDKGIELQLLIEKAKKDGITNDPIYKKEVELVKDSIALRAWQAKKINDMKISDSDIKKFYNDNKAKFVEPARARASHILVESESEAKSIISSLKGLSGTELENKFAELARSKSIEPVAKQSGGELGWFAAGQMVKPFSDAVFAMKKGEVSAKPVKSQFGYHIIYKVDDKGKRQASLEEAKNFIEGILKQDKLKEQIGKEATDLRKKAKVEYK